MKAITRLDAINLAITAVTALLTSLVLLVEEIDQFPTSNAFAVMYSVVDIAWLPLVLLSVIVFGRRQLVRHTAALPRAMSVLWRRQREHPKDRVVIAAVTGVAVILVGIGLYQARYLALGTYSRWAYHSETLAERSAGAFLDGDHTRARQLLRICDQLYAAERCRTLSERVEERIARAALYTKLNGVLPAGSGSRPTLLLGRYMLDRDWDTYVADVEKIVQERNLVEREYRNALMAVASGKVDDATRLLESVQRDWPGFGAAHRFLDELDRARRSGLRGVDVVAATRTPYLSALRSMGIDAVAALTVEIHEPRRLQTPVDEIPGLLDLDGLLVEDDGPLREVAKYTGLYDYLFVQ